MVNTIKTFSAAYGRIEKAEDPLRMLFRSRNLLRLKFVVLCLLFAINAALPRVGLAANSLSQFGITWTFDRDYQVGQFANGDYWVVGPVTVTSVSPDPSSGRHGSMINPMTGSSQGYDSRIANYDSSLSVSFPKTLQPGESLASTESLIGTDCSGGNIDLMGTCVSSAHAYLKNAAVLTVLASDPPIDSFRPPFVGSEKPVYTTSQLQRQILPKLANVPSTPALATYERYLQRPWLNHKTDWTCRMMHPTQNMPNYYREAFLIYSTVPLLLSLDFTDQEKETLLIRFVQLGIDQYATILNGSGDRMIGKGPIALVGLLLNDPGMLSYSYGYREIKQTYYYDDPALPEFDNYGNKLRGQLGWTGATALWGSWGTATSKSYEHIHPSQWRNVYTDTQGPEGACKLDDYRFCCSSHTYVGEALAAHIIPGLKEAWNHPAFFDYVDRWMTEDVPWGVRDATCGSSWITSIEKSPGSTFIGDMWDTYRALTYEPDDTPPLPPTNLISTAQTENSISLSWTAPGPASDGDLASMYRILQNGILIGLAAATATSFQDTGLAADTSYSYDVYSVDDAGNQSVSATTGTFSTLADTTPPSVVSVNATSEISVKIVFSESVDPSSAEDINNYSINNGISITTASLIVYPNIVILTTNTHTEGITYTLTVANVQDTSGNPIPETTTNYKYDVGLVAHWKFDDDLTDSIATEETGNHNASCLNCPSLTTDRNGDINKAYQFDGANSYLTIPDDTDFVLKDFALSAWIKTSDAGSGRRRIISQQITGGEYWILALYNNQLEVSSHLDSILNKPKGPALNDNSWHHVAGVRDTLNNLIYWYVDGVEIGTEPALSDASYDFSLDVQIGRYLIDDGRAGEYFNGAIDEVRVYNRALNAAEILELYGEAPPADTNGPVISNIASSNITSSGATITWTTDENSTSQVEYGLSTTYGNTTALDATLVTSHSVLLTGLASETLYHYRVRSRDASGNESVGQDNTFTTSGASTYSITASAGAGGAISPSGTTQVSSGGAQTYTITPDTGYHIADVLVDGSSVGAVSSYSFTNVTANHTTAATFAVNTYTITSSACSGGQISPTGTTQVTYGGSQTYTITPNTGYQIADVVVDGSSVGAVSSYSFTNVTANHTIAATFAINTYSITASAGSGGQISPGGTTQVNWGSTQSYTITSNTGYHIADVVVDGSSVGAVGSYSFTNVTANHTIVASFAVDDQDTTPPTVTNLSPEANAIQVPLNNLIILHIVDAGDGVDANFVTITVNGDVVYAGNTAHYNGPYGDCHRTGTKADYTYIYQANAMFDFDQTVNVTVDAKDLAGNELSGYTYSFNTEMRSFGSNSKVSSTNLSDGAPVTVADSSGNIWAAWHMGPAGSRDIYVGRLAAGAASFGSSLQLTGDVADQYNAAIAMDTDDKLYVVWQDNRRGNWDIFISTSVDGINWSAETRVTDSNDNQINPAIVVDGSSPENVYIVWQDDRGGNQDIYIASSSNDFLTETLSQITSDSADQTEPAIAADSDNTIYVVWTDARNSSSDIYGAASNSGPWTNVAIVSNANNQSSPAIATEAVGSILHLLWVDDTSGDQDIYYAASNGLPGSPLSGSSIIDDTSGSNQSEPVIVVTGSTGDNLKVFACWQDTRDSDIDLYFDEITSSSGTDVFVGDDSTNTDQSEPAMGTDIYGHPYLVWVDNRNTNTDIYYAGSTFTGVDVLAAEIVSSSTGAMVGTDPSAISGVDDVSVVVPAGAYSRDIEITISRVTNPLRSGVEYLSLPYEFGPSGIEFDQPVTITIPYEVPASGYSISAYWYNVLTGAPSQQGITDVETIVISSTLHALRFKTTHFTQFFVGGSSGGSTGSGGGGGGGCSISAAGEGSIVEFLLPYIGLAVVMVVIKCRDVRNRKSRNITKSEY